MYHILPDRIIAASPKVASTSIQAALEPYNFPHYSAGARACPPIEGRAILFVRDPIERFISGYRFLSRAREILICYRGFVDQVLDGWMDMHIQAQRDYHSIDGEFKPTELYPFERLGEIWPFVGMGDLPVKNASPKNWPDVDISYRLEELQNYYAKDYELRAAL